MLNMPGHFPMNVVPMGAKKKCRAASFFISEAITKWKEAIRGVIHTDTSRAVVFQCSVKLLPSPQAHTPVAVFQLELIFSSTVPIMPFPHWGTSEASHHLCKTGLYPSDSLRWTGLLPMRQTRAKPFSPLLTNIQANWYKISCLKKTHPIHLSENLHLLSLLWIFLLWSNSSLSITHRVGNEKVFLDPLDYMRFSVRCFYITFTSSSGSWHIIMKSLTL